MKKYLKYIRYKYKSMHEYIGIMCIV